MEYTPTPPSRNNGKSTLVRSFDAPQQQQQQHIRGPSFLSRPRFWQDIHLKFIPHLLAATASPAGGMIHVICVHKRLSSFGQAFTDIICVCTITCPIKYDINIHCRPCCLSSASGEQEAGGLISTPPAEGDDFSYHKRNVDSSVDK